MYSRADLPRVRRSDSAGLSCPEWCHQCHHNQPWHLTNVHTYCLHKQCTLSQQPLLPTWTWTREYLEWKLQLHGLFDPAAGGPDGCGCLFSEHIFTIQAACWLVVRESVSPHLPWCVKIVTNVSWVWFVRLFGQILSWHVTWQRIMTDITAAIYILWGAERGTSIRWRYTLHQQHTAELQPRTPTRHHTTPASSKFKQDLSSGSIVSI